MNIKDLLDPGKLPITEEEFNAFVVGELEMLKMRMADKPDSLMPYVAVKTMDMDGKEGIALCAIAMPFNEAEEKNAALTGIGASVYKDKKLPVAVSLTCEAWMARKLDDGVQPRNSPDKKEVVILVAMDLTGNLNKIVCLPVKRDEKNGMEIIEEEPKVDETPDRKSVRSPLLTHFFRGYAMAVVKDGFLNVPSEEESSGRAE